MMMKRGRLQIAQIQHGMGGKAQAGAIIYTRNIAPGKDRYDGEKWKKSRRGRESGGNSITKNGSQGSSLVYCIQRGVIAK